MNLGELVRERAREAPDKTALRHGHTSVEGSVTFGELDAEVDRVAGALQSWGVEVGDRVAIVMGNVVHFAYAYFGILRAGAVAVPINTMLTVEEVARILGDSGARLVMSAAPLDSVARAASEQVATIERVVTTADWSSLPDAAAHPVDRSDDDLAVLVYTSGTTGAPKGAMLSHGNLLVNLEQQMQIPEARVDATDVLLLALPLFHIFGLNVTLGLVARSGATGVLLERFEPVATLRAIEHNRITVLFGAPPMYVAWINTPGAEQYDLSSVRLAVSGAAPLGSDTLESFRAIFGVDIWEGYGLTETAPSVTSNRMADAPRPGSIGMPLPGVELRLLDEAGNDVELGDPGEIAIRGPNVFKGYWNRPDLTEAAFSDGWFRTGDIAVQDEQGYLYIVDRKRDLIIVSGFNVFPSEVEDVLASHPKVCEAAVVGVPHRYTGEAVKAYVVLAPGASASPQEILDDVAPRLARFKRPESIEIVDELPHLASGKISRRALR